MSSRIPSHQLSNGLTVSGRPDHHKPPPPPLASRAAPFTGGDSTKSGELARMLNPTVPLPTPSRTQSRPRSRPGSGPIIQPTGLITSGTLGSNYNSGQPVSKKPGYGTSVTTLSGDDVAVGFAVSRVLVWVFLVVVMVGFLVGGFLVVAVKKGVVLFGVCGIVGPVVLVLVWNFVWRRNGVERFVKRYRDAELMDVIDGEFVKVTGMVTCGSVPLETSYGRVQRCVYVSTDLYEYKGWGGKSANPKHRCFSWGARHSERHVADFYISDFQSGLRALVKAGYGAKVALFVKPGTVLDVTEDNRDFAPSFTRWLGDRNLSSDDRIMRLKEGYIKEGSTVSVMGVVQRHDNVLMIVPPAKPVSTGCQWGRFLLPTYVEGLIVKCDDNQDEDVVAV